MYHKFYFLVALHVCFSFDSQLSKSESKVCKDVGQKNLRTKPFGVVRGVSNVGTKKFFQIVIKISSAIATGTLLPLHLSNNYYYYCNYTGAHQPLTWLQYTLPSQPVTDHADMVTIPLLPSTPQPPGHRFTHLQIHVLCLFPLSSRLRLEHSFGNRQNWEVSVLEFCR